MSRVKSDYDKQKKPIDIICSNCKNKTTKHPEDERNLCADCGYNVMMKPRDKFSEEHPYCYYECAYCSAGKHSKCEDIEKCHNREGGYFVDLD